MKPKKPLTIEEIAEYTVENVRQHIKDGLPAVPSTKEILRQQIKRLLEGVEDWFGAAFISSELTSYDRVLAWTIKKKDWTKFKQRILKATK